MTQNILTAGNATSNLSTAAGDDGTFKIVVGPNGSQVDALAFSAAGVPTFAALTKSLGASGSIVLPGGLIVKWGSATSGGATNTVTYPTAFPTATVFATCIHTTAAVYIWPITAKSAASFNNICYNTGGTPTGSIAYDWLAIGY